MRPVHSSELGIAILVVLRVVAACGPTSVGPSPPSDDSCESAPPLSFSLPTVPPPAEDDHAYWLGNCPTCCPEWGCGTNGAWLGGNLVFHEIDASGTQENSANLLFAGFFDRDSNPLQLEVDHDVLLGTCLPNNPKCQVGQVLMGKDLVGSQIKLFHILSPTVREEWTLKIQRYCTTTSWVKPAGVKVPAYQFTFDGPGVAPRTALCRPPADRGDQWKALAGMALIFRGDRYIAASKTVTETGGNDSWFNIACAGTTISKMHLLRHTWAGNSDGQHTTTLPQRQAVLDMLAGAYCGDGMSFTVDGHPLLYSYKQSWPPYLPYGDASTPLFWSKVRSIDAAWDENGAQCLGVPRLDDTYSDIKSAIDARCPKDPCTPDLLDKLHGPAPGSPWQGYAISANQFPLP